jgi:hypothetical protein
MILIDGIPAGLVLAMVSYVKFDFYGFAHRQVEDRDVAMWPVSLGGRIQYSYPFGSGLVISFLLLLLLRRNIKWTEKAFFFLSIEVGAIGTTCPI